MSEGERGGSGGGCASVFSAQVLIHSVDINQVVLLCLEERFDDWSSTPDTISSALHLSLAHLQDNDAYECCWLRLRHDHPVVGEQTEFIKYQGPHHQLMDSLTHRPQSREEVKRLVDWCCENNLILNVEKTEELIIDFRRKQHSRPPLISNNKAVEEVSSTKFRGGACNGKAGLVTANILWFVRSRDLDQKSLVVGGKNSRENHWDLLKART
ncbi:hypothetical protein D4764_02G0002170 [Takifugu flavidus]|uniref:Alkylated DNA repair protein AlkB homologue 8 N-terminal domain-containing protein n=1 Tax=Takifugu flavidus TaxID=433684 RepID=A0A5C6NJ82_9TELE|nr:hypothetical protein D4764_02G0002170 [Takifugu flavidus]